MLKTELVLATIFDGGIYVSCSVGLGRYIGSFSVISPVNEFASKSSWGQNDLRADLSLSLGFCELALHVLEKFWADSVYFFVCLFSCHAA